MWKTTDRYVQQKRIKAAEAESKLKQVYIPNYNKPNPAQIVDKMNGVDSSFNHACESCYTNHSTQWFSWGPVQMQCRLCATCWNYWKKYGGLKMPTRLDGGNLGDRSMHGSAVHRCSVSGCGKEFRVKSQLVRHLVSSHGLVVGPGSPCPVMKTRAAFCLVTTPLTRVSRRICRSMLNVSRAARQPFVPINIAVIKQECQQRLPDLTKNPHIAKVKRRVPMDDVSARLGVDTSTARPVLLQQNPSQISAPRCAFPRQPALSPAAGPLSTSRDHSPIRTGQCGPPIMRKRGHEHFNGTEDVPAAKCSSVGVIHQPTSSRLQSDLSSRNRGNVINRVNGKGAREVLVGRSRKHILNWVDTPDDVYFVSNQSTRKLRRQMPSGQLKRAARQPWNKSLVVSGVSSAPIVKTMPPLLAPTVAKRQESVVVLD